MNSVTVTRKTPMVYFIQGVVALTVPLSGEEAR